MRALGPVHIDGLIRWIEGIEFTEWPQQARLADGKLRPAMVTDLDWHGFGAMTDGIVADVSGPKAYQRMLSVVMPGHEIEPHQDRQAPYWKHRVHVPLTSNPKALFIIEGEPWWMAPGIAFAVDTRRLHSVVNVGDTPRVHLMWDVRQ